MADSGSKSVELAAVSPETKSQPASVGEAEAVVGAGAGAGAGAGVRAASGIVAPSNATLFAASKLNILKPCEPVTLVWKDISLSVDVSSASKGGSCCNRRSKDAKPDLPTTKQILFNINGALSPGEFVGILGASGAGKTSFLDVLSGRRSQYTGTYTMNGEAVTEEVFKHHLAFVQQEDLFLNNLTVREQLEYTAVLRLARTTSAKERAERVEELIQKLGLSKVADSVIGSRIEGIGAKGISGGERKRLSFACEVITDPSVLMCDEVTSGLDAGLAESVVRQLRDLAMSGRSVVTTIHQPSSDVFALFSKIMVLSEGRVVYYGPRSQAVAYFSSIGLQCPTYSNPADFFIKVLTNSFGEEDAQARLQGAMDNWAQYVADRSQGDALPAAADGDGFDAATWRFFAQYRGALEDGIAGEEPLTEEENDGVVSGAARQIAKFHADSSVHLTPATDGYANSWGKEVMILTRRGLVNTARDPVLTKARIMQTVVLGLLFGLIFLDLEDSQQGVQDKSGAIFFVMVNQSMMGVFGVLQTFPLERPAFFREHQNGMYRVSSYYVAKQLGDLPYQIIFPAVFIVATYWMMNIRNDAVIFLSILGILLLVTNCAMSLGYALSASAPSVSMALALGPVMILPFMLFAGLFINTESIPDYFIWLEWISFFKYGFLSSGYLIWKDVDAISCDRADPADCPFENGQDVIDFYKFDDRTGLFIGLLVIFLVVVRLLGLIGLQYRAYKNQQQ